MWPWGHAIAGYVVATVLVLLYRRRPLQHREAIVVVVGSQLPDLVDKPLAWTLAVLPHGRSLGHSLITWSAVGIVIVLILRRHGRFRLAPFAFVGAVVGTLTDVPPSALDGDVSRATFLLWPVLEPPAAGVEPSLLASAGRLGGDDVGRLVVFTAMLLGFHVLLTRLRSTDAVAD